MSDFFFLFRGGDNESTLRTPAQIQDNMQKWMAWLNELGTKGIMKGGEPLRTVGKVVTGNARTVTDGPYAEAKDLVGGYIVVTAKDIDEAVAISKGCPILDEPQGSVEIREIQVVEMPPS